MNNVEKPISMIIYDVKKELSEVINNSNLPMCIISPILQNLLNEVCNMERQEYLTTKKEYEELLSNNDKNIKTKDKS